MTPGRTIALLLLLSALVAVIWQGSALTNLRRQSRALQSAQEEASRLGLENQELSQLRAKTGTNSGSGGGSLELLRLRNEVGQLRAQRSEWEALKAANERLAEDIRSGETQDFSKMEGFLAKEAWGNAGFDTPDATVQTFFWAIREGDLGQIAECMSPEARDYLLRLTEQGFDQARAQALGEFQVLTHGSGFRIVNRAEEKGKLTRGAQTIVDGTIVEGTSVPAQVTFGLQAIAGGAVVPMHLRRYDDGWKVSGF